MSNLYDLIIIGAGPAGITAAVYAARKRMSLLVISKDVGGQAALSGDIENYTGYQFISGVQLAAKFEEHMRKFGIELKEGEETTEITKKNNGTVSVKTDKGIYFTKTAIIASGKRSRKLGIPGEDQFKNKGLTYCATCDGPLFAQKEVAVVGGGNSALDATLGLIKIAKRIYLINITSALAGDMIMQEKVNESSKVSILNNTRLTVILGDKMLSAIKIKREGQEAEEKLSVEGVFVEVGLIPNSEFAGELERNEEGEIKVDSRNQTNLAGIFAAGDVTDVPEKQIIIAAGEGSKAALSAFRYLARRK